MQRFVAWKYEPSASDPVIPHWRTGRPRYLSRAEIEKLPASAHKPKRRREPTMAELIAERKAKRLT